MHVLDLPAVYDLVGEALQNVSRVPVRFGLELRFLEVSYLEEKVREFLVRACAFREKIVDLLCDPRADTGDLVRTPGLGEFARAGDAVRQVKNCIGRAVVGHTLDVRLLVRGEVDEHLVDVVVVGGEELVVVVVGFLDTFLIGGGIRLDVIRIFGGIVLVGAEKRADQGFGGRVVKRFVPLLVAETVEFLEGGDAFVVRLREELLELLDFFARLFMQSLELGDVFGDGFGVHGWMYNCPDHGRLRLPK